MRTSNRIAAGLAIAATALALPFASQASAQSDTSQARTITAAPRGDAGTAAVGFANHVTRTPTWVFQCPYSFCNRAENVIPADDLSDVCFVSSTAVEGNVYWDLVYVRTASKRYVGFVPEAYLQNKSQLTPC